MTPFSPDFYDDAACVGLPGDLFYPPQNGTADKVGTIAQAKQVCSACPVRQTCLEYALRSDAGDWGIWGGLTREERRQHRGGTRASIHGVKPRRREVAL